MTKRTQNKTAATRSPWRPRSRGNKPERKELRCKGLGFRGTANATLSKRSKEKMTAPQTPDLKTIKGRQQKAWTSGDYGKVGVTLAMIGELLCEAVDPHPGQRVLDVACGNGNASLAAARRFCEVVGIDYVPTLLEQGRERAQADGLAVDFREGDAEDMPFPDASFDVVISTLGVMFAPNQQKAAEELLRVARPG